MRKVAVVFAVLTMVISFSVHYGYAQTPQGCYNGIQVGQVCYVPCGGPSQELCYESYCNVYIPSLVPDALTTAGADLSVGQIDYEFCEGCPISECVVYVPSGMTETQQ
jgi:hypothetical protein